MTNPAGLAQTVETYEFVVPGNPVTQGSVQPGIDKSGNLYTRHDNRTSLMEWRTTCQQAIMAARAKHRMKAFPKGCPVRVEATFVFAEPKRPTYDFPPKDIDKLSRALLDALKGLLHDDNQVVRLEVEKRYVGWNGDPQEKPHTDVMVEFSP